MQGQNNTWFAGAYTRYGFHEDGLLSAVNVAKAMGAAFHGNKATTSNRKGHAWAPLP